MWQHSFLTKGELVNIPSTLFQEPDKAKKRLIASRYYDEYPNGIRVECEFPSGKYKMFISWASIYCGAVKVKDDFGNEVKAIREY